MFARLKTRGKAVYVQVIAYVPGEPYYRRRASCPGRPPRKVVVATLGRVDHLTAKDRADIQAALTQCLEGVRPTGKVTRPLRLTEHELVRALDPPRKGGG